MNHSVTNFPNGLRLVNIEKKDSDSVSFLILVGTGSRYEEDNVGGIAHFVEHTIFKGTPTRPSTNKISMEVETMGAKMNAFTSYDYTGYFIKSPKKYFEKAGDILSDMFLNSLFRQEDIEKERGVILEELKMYEDQPMDKVSSVFSKALYGKHPLGRDIIGTEKSINSLTQKDFFKFIEKFYAPSNIVIVVSGNFDEKQARELVEKNFSSLKDWEKPKIERVFENNNTKKRLHTLYKPINQTHLNLGGYTKGRISTGKEDKYRLKVLNALLGRGFGSKLFQEIREKQGLAYYVYSNVSIYDEVGHFAVGAGVDNKNLQKAVDAILEQFEALRKGHIKEDEVRRGKNYLIGGLTVNMETTDQVALWYGLQLLLEDEIHQFRDIEEMINSISKDDLINLANVIFREGNLLLAIVSPEKDVKVDFNY